jgi:hypothetical protein
MSELTTMPLCTKNFRSAVEAQAENIVLRLVGTADLDVYRGLGSMLGELHADARRVGAQRVEVDVTGLEFMNSSCFKSFVSWLTNIMELPEGEQYRVHFRANPATLWQRRSLHALRSFALMVVTVEEV